MRPEGSQAHRRCTRSIRRSVPVLDRQSMESRQRNDQQRCARILRSLGSHAGASVPELPARYRLDNQGETGKAQGRADDVGTLSGRIAYQYRAGEEDLLGRNVWSSPVGTPESCKDWQLCHP